MHIKYMEQVLVHWIANIHATQPLINGLERNSVYFIPIYESHTVLILQSHALAITKIICHVLSIQIYLENETQ